MSPRLAMSALVILCLASIQAAHSDLGGQLLLPALKEVGKALSEAEAGNRAAVLKAHDALWPALKASLLPLLAPGDAPSAATARRRLAATGAAAPPAAPLTLRNFNQTMELLGQYSTKMLQLEALDVEQTVSNNLKAALGMEVNQTALLQTKAATEAMQSALSAVALTGLNSGLKQLKQLQTTAQLLRGLSQSLVAANNATSTQLSTVGLGWQNATQSMLQQLSGQLAPMLSAAAAASSAAASLSTAAGSASGRRLQEAGEQARSADRLQALSARFQGLRDSRIALREWLAVERASRSTNSDPASSGTSGASGSQRRLRQEDGAHEAAPPLLLEGAPSEQTLRGEELPPLLLVLQGDDAGNMPLWQESYVIIEEASLPPAVGQAMVADMLSLLRDALDFALVPTSGIPITPVPAGAPVPAGPAVVEAQPAAVAADARRRLRQAGSGSTAGEASLFPALPAGRAPLPVGSSADEADAFMPDAAYYESYDDYSDEVYYEEMEDWMWAADDGDMTADSLGSLIAAVLAQLQQQADAVATTTASSNEGDGPTLPVFAVFASSSHAGVVPSSSGSGVVVEQARPLELLVAPFSAEARSAVPHTDGRSGGLPFDPRWFGVVVSAACMGLLAGLMAVLKMVWQRRSAGMADQEETLLYSHIPGTPSKKAAAATGSAAAASEADAAAGPVVKKFSNLPA